MIVGRDSIHLIYRTVDRSRSGLQSMTNNLKRALGQSARLSQSLATIGGRRLLSGIRSVAGAVGQLTGALGAIGTGGVLATLTALSLRGQEVASAYDRYAASLGGTAEQIQRITSASSAGFDDTLESLKNLRERIGEGATEPDGGIAEAFAGIGIDPQELQQLAGADIETVFLRYADAIAQSSDNSVALFRNMELLGDEGFRILSTMAKGSENLRRETELLDEAFGLVVDDDVLQRQRDFRRSLGITEKVFRSLSVEIAGQFAPILDSVIVRVLAFIKANGGVGEVVTLGFQVAGRAIDGIRGFIDLAIDSVGSLGLTTANVAAGIANAWGFVSRAIANINRVTTAVIAGTISGINKVRALGAVVANPIDGDERRRQLAEIEADNEAFLDLGRARLEELDAIISADPGQNILDAYESVIDRTRAVVGDVDAELRVLNRQTETRMMELQESLASAINAGAGDAVEDAIRQQIALLRQAANQEREEIQARPPGFTFAPSEQDIQETRALLDQLRATASETASSVGGALGVGRNESVALASAARIEEFTAEKDAARETEQAIRNLSDAELQRINQQSEIPEIAAGPGAQARDFFALENIDVESLITPIESTFDRVRALFDEDFGVTESIRSGLIQIDEIFRGEFREINASVDIPPEERQRLIGEAQSLRDEAKENLRAEAELVINARIQGLGQNLGGVSDLLGGVNAIQQQGLAEDQASLLSLIHI